MGKHMIRYVGAFAPYLGTKARGSYIYDDTGRAILDFCSGQMCATLGHNHPAVTEAIEQSCRDVIHLFSGVLSPPVLRLAEELGAILPPGLQKMMFMSTGSESNEAAVRMAKLKTGGFEVARADRLLARHHRRRRRRAPTMAGAAATARRASAPWPSPAPTATAARSSTVATNAT